MPSTASVKTAKRPSIAPAPGLSRLATNVKVNDTEPSAKKDEIPIVQIEGDTCKRFNEAKKAIKDAEAVVKELESTIHERAMAKIFAHNCDPNCLQQLTSVKLQD